MPNSPIKVFLAEDSPVALTILQRILDDAPEIEVVGTAHDGKIALEQIPQLQPDVICTDLLMSKMDGLELTKQIMAKYPRPILVISHAVQPKDNNIIGQLLAAGAVDVFPKPNTGLLEDYEQQQQALIEKIKILSGVKVFTKRLRSSVQETKPQFKKPDRISASRSLSEPLLTFDASDSYKIIGIGVSTGGPSATQEIFSALPSDFPVPIVCIQHISEGFLGNLISWLDSVSPLQVKIAQPGELPLPRTIYFAPEKYHLELDLQGRFCYSSAPPLNSHRPSVTVTLQSLAKFYGKSAIGILLTGMGRDGVLGMQSIQQLGGMTIAQDESTSTIFGMPREAIEAGAAQHVLPLPAIAPFLVRKVR